MAVEAYVRIRRKLFRNLADQCHDRALETHSPKLAAEWATLCDALLWTAYGEGDADQLIARLAKATDQ